MTVFNREAVMRFEPAYLSAQSCSGAGGGCYQPPGRTVDIDVVSTGPEFAATLRSLEVSDAQEILERTKAFVEGGPGR
jgi:hypothetical protein